MVAEGGRGGGRGRGEGERNREREKGREREKHMLHYLLGLTSYSSCACWRATSATHSTSVEKLEARQIQPRLGIARRSMYIRGCPTLLPFTSLRASPHSPRPDPTPAKGEVCEFHKQQQHQLSDNNRTYPFPYSIPLVSRQQFQEEAPGWEAQGDVADADRSHAPLEDECRLVLPIDFRRLSWR